MAHIKAKTLAISSAGRILVNCERIRGDDRPLNRDKLAAENKMPFEYNL